MQFNKNRLIYISFGLILLLAIGFINRDIIKIAYQSYDVEHIVIEDNSLSGNTENNINNYGLVSETKESIFHTNGTYLYSASKENVDKTVLINSGGKMSKDTINVVGDWVFFRNGKDIKRMKLDGSSVVSIFKGYSIDMHVIGNWIYFMNMGDGAKIYKMDVNGENREILFDKGIEDMAIYNDKIYYSYEYNEINYLETMNFDGTDKQLLSNIKTRNMIVDNDYIYYLQKEDDQLYRVKLVNNLIETLSDEKIGKFCKDDKWIFYTLKTSSDSYRRFKGLYRMNIDGSNVLDLDPDVYLSEVGIGITEDWIFYVPDAGPDFPILKRIRKDRSSVEGETN